MKSITDLAKIFSPLFLFSILFISLESCNDDGDEDDVFGTGTNQDNVVIDIDGNQYDIIDIEVNASVEVHPNGIGISLVPTTQRWLKQNLRTTKLNDGVELILNEGDEDMGAFHYCWYDNSENFAKESIGALYHQSAVNTEKLCPVGWKVPSDEDWLALEYTLGIGIENGMDLLASEYRGDSTSYKLKEMISTFWDASNEYSTDIYNLQIRGGGLRWNRLSSQFPNYFDNISKQAFYYSSTPGEWNSAGFFLRGFDDGEGGILRFEPSRWPGGDMVLSCYVRCIEDTIQ
jgi:uncharacterized protein (TIGR02145 family)